MSQHPFAHRLPIGLAIVLCFVLAGLAGAQQTDEPTHVRVKKIIKKCDGDGCADAMGVAPGDAEKVVRVNVIRECQGENCEEGDGEHTIVFVGEDGEAHVVRGEGGSFAWRSSTDGDGPRGMAFGAGRNAFLGIRLTDLTPELRIHFGGPEDAGVMVSQVVEDSPAFRAGILVGDIVSAVNGARVSNARALAGSISAHEAGQVVDIELWRDGKLEKLSATLETPKEVWRQAVRRLDEHDADVFILECAGEDCQESTRHQLMGEFDCGDSGECEVQVQCENGECSCTVNGESTDCPDGLGDLP